MRFKRSDAIRSHLSIVWAFILGASLAGDCSSLQAATPTQEIVAQWLASEVLPPGLVLDEFRQWCESRIVAMPSFEQADDWKTYQERIRTEVLDRVVLRGAPASWRNAAPRVEWGERLETGSGYSIRKLKYEALPGLWIPALLYEPTELKAKAPVALHVNGHDPDGKGASYKQIRSINLAKRGIITLNVEWLGMGQLRGTGYAHGRMNQLELAGTSGLAPFYLAMQRGLDVVLAHDFADPKRVAVSGLSGGGWQTIYLSALDPRVTLANPVAGYSSFKTRLAHHSDLGDSEQTPTDMATIVDYTHLTALRAPRPTLLTYNSKDNCCFASAHALPPLLEAAGPVFKLLDAPSALRSHVNDVPGTHNYERENREAYYAILADYFAPAGAEWPRTEIPCAEEVKKASELDVELPASNEDFHSLAVELAQGLPRDAATPKSLDDLATWRRDRRLKLARLLRTPTLNLHGQSLGSEVVMDVRVTRWRLRIGESWTVPAVELTPMNFTSTVLLVADAGRKSAGDLAREQLAKGHRVLAIDPFYLGESAFAQRPYLFALLAATVGDRPLGLQARQIAAVARWAGERSIATSNIPAKPGTIEGDASRGVVVVARGPRATLAALCAAASEDDSIERLELHQSLGSLHEVLEKNWSYEQAPECFCFGLLEQFDIRSLVELIAPRPVAFVGADERLHKEIVPVVRWYKTLGKSFSPVDEPLSRPEAGGR